MKTISLENVGSAELPLRLAKQQLCPTWLSLLLGFFILHSAFCLRVEGQNYSIDWYKVAGGGGASTNGQYSLISTIGQPDASGALSGGNYTINGGFLSLYALVQTPGAPLLTITRVGTNAIVSWPSPSTGYVLQTNSSLSPGTWVNYGGIVGDNGSIKTQTNSPPTGKLFFRLCHP